MIKQCNTCGKPFKANHPAEKYCDETCRKFGYSKRQKRYLNKKALTK